MATKDDILTLEVDVDTRRAIQESAKFQRQMLQQMEKLSSAIDQSTGAGLNAAKKSAKATKDWEEAVDDTTDSYKDQSKEVAKLDVVISKLKEKAAKASKRDKKGIQAQISLLEKERKTNIKVAKSVAKTGGSKGAKGGKSEMGTAFKAPFKSFAARDLKGTLIDSAELFGKAAKASLMKGGGFLRGTGAGMGARGAAIGGPKGMAMKGGAAMMGTIGKLAQTLAKIGPILSMASGAIIGLVKLFIDLDSKAKEFNQELLTSASTSEFFYSNLEQADVAALELTDTLDAIRDAAHDIRFNFKWGVLAEDHIKMLNVLTQEGVSLHSIKTEAESAARSMGKGTQTAEEFASAVADYEHQLVATSLAFSRSFGLPLSEINQMQAEMMRDLGMSLQDTQLAFHQVSRTAAESGVSANKFFAMIRGASQDLSLYNTRMEDAVKILGLMNRVMNPRNAQKFFQTAVQGLKNMGQDERLKLNLLTGAKGAKILEKDLKRRETTVNREIGAALGMQGDQVAKQLSDPKLAKDIWQRLQKATPERAGALREAAGQLRLDRRASKRGVYGQAFAMENLSAGAALDAISSALVKWGGGKSLTEGAGTIGLTKMAENLGIGTEQLRNMMLLEDAVEDQRDALVAEGKMTREQAEKLSAGDIMDTMSEDMQEQLKNSNKEINYAKEQTELTRSWTKSFEMLVQFIMNELYNIMSDILETIQSFPFFKGDKARSKLNITKQVKGNMELTKILRETGDDLGKFHKQALQSETGKSVTRQLTGFGAEFKRLEEERQKQAKIADEGVTEEERKAAKNRVASLEKEQGALTDSQRKLQRGISAQFKKNGTKVVDILEKENIGNLSMKQKQQLTMDVGSGKDIYDSLSKAGLDENQIAKFFAKSLWRLSAEQLAGVLTDFGKAPTGGAPTAPAPKTSAQQEAAAKSGATSMPGGGAAAVTAPAAAPAPTMDKEALGAALEKSGIEVNKATTEQLQGITGLSAEQIEQLKGVEKKLGEVKFDKAFLKSDWQRSMENATLDAVRKALFEYYMYSAIEDRSKVADYLAKGGGDIGTFASEVGDAAMSGMLATDVLEAHQAGGMVTGVRDGLAQVTAAAGEGLASVGPGERIVPAGGAPGGGTSIVIPVNGIGGEDLARLIRAKVIDGIAEYKRRERFT